MTSPPIATETIHLYCPICGHTFTQFCPVDQDEVILLEDDLCPLCGAQAEPDPP